jgi:hypothetical protein
MTKYTEIILNTNILKCSAKTKYPAEKGHHDVTRG